MNDHNKETTDIMNSVDEIENTTVQIHKFVYDPEMAEDECETDVNYHLVIYTGTENKFSKAAHELLHALAIGRIHSIGIESDSEGESIIRISAGLTMEQVDAMIWTNGQYNEI